MLNRALAFVGELQEIGRRPSSAVSRKELFDRRWRQWLLNNGLLMVKTAS